MNKTELIAKIAEKTDLSKVQTENFVNSFIDIVSETMVKDDKITLVGFGTFKVTKRKAREGRNPATGETIKIPASKVVKFVPGKALKESL